MVHTWEKASPLEEETLSTLQKLARAAAKRPVPKHVRDERSRTDDTSESTTNGRISLMVSIGTCTGQGRRQARRRG